MYLPKGPKRIIFLRSAQSLAVDQPSLHGLMPDHRIALSESGRETAAATGKTIRALIGAEPVYFYVSPYRRCVDTYQAVRRALLPAQFLGAREEPRLREQQYGNFSNPTRIALDTALRRSFGRFFYRYEHGESAADVYGRMSAFIDTVLTDFSARRFPNEVNVVMVAHGLTMRLFLMRWFHMCVDAFERMSNPPPGFAAVLTREADGSYRLGEEAKLTLRIPDAVPGQECPVHGMGQIVGPHGHL